MIHKQQIVDELASLCFGKAYKHHKYCILIGHAYQYYPLLAYVAKGHQKAHTYMVLQLYSNSYANRCRMHRHVLDNTLHHTIIALPYFKLEV